MTTVSLVILALSAVSFSSGDIVIGNFNNRDLSGWSDKVFKGRTVYELVNDEGRTVIKAHSVRSASGLLKKIKLDSKEYPILRWSWKIENTLKREDVNRKSGDDFAARVYVVFPEFFFWQTKAINYVWSDKMTRESWARNPYTSNSIIIAVESGDSKVGKWVNEERNIHADFLRVFGKEPSKLGAIAIMTDTDDTKDEATAYYGDILLGPGK
jgi:hypothetical protein